MKREITPERMRQASEEANQFVDDIRRYTAWFLRGHSNEDIDEEIQEAVIDVIIALARSDYTNRKQVVTLAIRQGIMLRRRDRNRLCRIGNEHLIFNHDWLDTFPAKDSDADAIEHNLARAQFVLDCMPPDIRLIAIRHFWLGVTLTALQQELGICQQAMYKKMQKNYSIIRNSMKGLP